MEMVKKAVFCLFRRGLAGGGFAPPKGSNGLFSPLRICFHVLHEPLELEAGGDTVDVSSLSVGDQYREAVAEGLYVDLQVPAYPGAGFFSLVGWDGDQDPLGFVDGAPVALPAYLPDELHLLIRPPLGSDLWFEVAWLLRYSWMGPPMDRLRLEPLVNLDMFSPPSKVSGSS